MGNVALKTSEGAARFITASLRERFCASGYNRLLCWLTRPMLKQWYNSMNPDRYNGAYLLGLNGTVVKSHGGVNQQQFAYALERLIKQYDS